MKNFIFYILFLASASANACIAKLAPDLHNLEKYSQIYIGEVTGVVLSEYESNRIKSIEKGENRKWFSDITLPHTVSAVVTKAFRGSPDIKVSYEIVGCGVVIPSPGKYGIFFVEAKSGKVIPIYENEGELYYEALVELGGDSR